MNDRVRRIHELVRQLSEATWARVETNPKGWPEIIFEESLPNGQPTTKQEIDTWRSLTSPANRDDFAEYLKYWEDTELNEFATKLHKAIKNEIERRLQEEIGEK
jgi:hypothetical protein